MDEKKFLKNYKLVIDGFLPGWCLTLNNSKRNAGLCFYPFRGRPGKISISRFYLQNPETTEEKLKFLILHEIAHAFAGKKAHHGEKWKKIVTELGGKPTPRLDKPFAADQAKFVAQCKSCGFFYYFFKKVKHSKRRCRFCKTQCVVEKIQN